jgi:queuine tRNA-ribosyltransferase
MGGLHRFMGWPHPILTDSGGYQVFSLATRRTVSDDGVVFQSHLDGRTLTLTPEAAVDIQAQLGADITMAFDECPSWPATHDDAARAMRRTRRWASRARARFLALDEGASGLTRPTPGQAQFGIVQGGTFPELRDESVAETVAIGFEAYAIGGLSVGEPVETMLEIAAHTASQLPEERPRYLMGVGTPTDLVQAVAAGLDMFDCVLPTRNARNGQLFTRFGPINIRNARYADDPEPVDPACGCPVCRRYSRSYLRHLAVSGEIGSATLNTLHNLHFYLDTMREIRKAIEFGTFDALERVFLDAYSRRQTNLDA